MGDNGKIFEFSYIFVIYLILSIFEQHTGAKDGNFAAPATPAPMTPASADPSIIPQLQNIVSTVNLGCKLDLKVHWVVGKRNKADTMPNSRIYVALICESGCWNKWYLCISFSP